MGHTGKGGGEVSALDWVFTSSTGKAQRILHPFVKFAGKRIARPRGEKPDYPGNTCVQPHYQTLQLIWRIAGDPEIVRAHNPDLLWADCIIPKNEHYISFACLDCLYEQSNPLPNGVDAEQGTLELEDPSGSCVHVLFLQAFLCTKFVEVYEKLPPPQESIMTSKYTTYTRFDAMHTARRINSTRLP
eukprot:g62886.t1